VRKFQEHNLRNRANRAETAGYCIRPTDQIALVPTHDDALLLHKSFGPSRPDRQTTSIHLGKTRAPPGFGKLTPCVDCGASGLSNHASASAVFKRHIDISTKISTQDYILRIFGRYGNFYGCF
jgi:hypothetical protein